MSFMIDVQAPPSPGYTASSLGPSSCSSDAGSCSSESLEKYSTIRGSEEELNEWYLKNYVQCLSKHHVVGTEQLDIVEMVRDRAAAQWIIKYQRVPLGEELMGLFPMRSLPLFRGAAKCNKQRIKALRNLSQKECLDRQAIEAQKLKEQILLQEKFKHALARVRFEEGLFLNWHTS